MALDLHWNKLRLGADIRSLLDRTVISLNQNIGGNLHVIKQPFGKIIACQAGNLLFFHVGDGGRPPQIWTLAASTDPGQRFLLPAQRAEDFEECCELLGLQGEAQRARFKDFLLPAPGRALTSTPQGAF